ncbi:DUF5677 domain-containing protein [Acidipila rosea]|uniref:Uncharacterized protein n=1 Tax=Acidipila rosea TaxID=768535 RepID=A0A4R1KTG2_9BACT|nr:DUF5677 domain-containing protein [Acidipila rosea]TCK68448.1 hypothetical protein C7378_3525 [Acidipila rosea]
MTQTVEPKCFGSGETLQRTLNEAVGNLPVLFLEHRIAEKLKLQDVKAPKGLARQIAKHILSGSSEPFATPRAARGKRVDITINDSDLEEVIRGLERFYDEQLPALLPLMAGKIAKNVLKNLKSQWPSENSLQETDILEFRKRIDGRWGKPLGQLRMLLTMSREWCQEINVRESRHGKHKNGRSRRLLIRLLVRACQVTDEILCLLENGFADGAMARWRTLHEIAVVAAVILQYGDEIAERYIDHQTVESKRSMDKYIACSQQLGYKPMTPRMQARITKAHEKVITKYGKTFHSDYGWAAYHLKKEKPNFTHLEEAAGRAEMRAHYQMGNDNVHAGIKSMYVRLGLIGDYEGLLAGRSNAGLTEPGQNAAHTLTQLAVLVCFVEPVFDDYVIADMLMALRDEIPRSFAKAEAQLKKDDRAIRGAPKPLKHATQKTDG